MQGHVIERGTTYSTVVDLPPGPDGKRRQKWTSGFPTRKQAQLALAQLVVELGTGTYVGATRRTLEQYLHEDWLPASAARVRPSTLCGYRQLLNGYVIPAIGQRRLDELDALTLTKLHGTLLTTPYVWVTRQPDGLDAPVGPASPAARAAADPVPRPPAHPRHPRPACGSAGRWRRWGRRTARRRAPAGWSTCEVRCPASAS